MSGTSLGFAGASAPSLSEALSCGRWRYAKVVGLQIATARFGLNIRMRATRYIKGIATRNFPSLTTRIRLHLNRYRSPQDVFSDVYARNIWGGNESDFYSGLGSDDVNSREYIEFVRAFIDRENIKSVLDVGCGDFRVSSKIISGLEIDYVGVDVVRSLIERNVSLYSSDRVRFFYRDACLDDLPEADLCLVRQVLQHLSNAQIRKMLGRLTCYRFVLFTEHQPCTPRTFNVDKPQGADTRNAKGSGVFLDKPPYNLAVRCVLVSSLVGQSGRLRTFLLENTQEGRRVASRKWWKIRDLA